MDSFITTIFVGEHVASIFIERHSSTSRACDAKRAPRDSLGARAAHAPDMHLFSLHLSLLPRIYLRCDYTLESGTSCHLSGSTPRSLQLEARRMTWVSLDTSRALILDIHLLPNLANLRGLRERERERERETGWGWGRFRAPAPANVRAGPLALGLPNCAHSPGDSWNAYRHFNSNEVVAMVGVSRGP